MKTASNEIQKTQKFPFHSFPPQEVSKLRSVAEAFVQLQESRHIADYDNSINWTRTEARAAALLAEKAMDDWESIRSSQIVHLYLVFLLSKHRD